MTTTTEPPENLEHSGHSETQALLRLMTWLSPSFPVGAFTYSHGLEYMIDAGRLRDRAGLFKWIASVLETGSGRQDAGFFVQAYRATAQGDWDRVAAVAERAGAMRGTAELALEADQQGRAFLIAVRKGWPSDTFQRFDDVLERLDIQPSYPVCVAVAAAVHGIGLERALPTYLHAVAANLVSAAVRLVPLGQTDGQATLAQLEDVVQQAAAAACLRSDGDLGSAGLMIDWASMQHETQYSRMFRS